MVGYVGCLRGRMVLALLDGGDARDHYTSNLTAKQPKDVSTGT